LERVDPQLLQKIKSEFRGIRDGEPGHCFVDRYERSRRNEGGRALWKTLVYVAAGLVLLISGLVLALPPGVPGFLLWIPGLALLAVRFKGLAKLLDRLEVWARKTWQLLTRR
jgi:hypothetical protein